LTVPLDIHSLASHAGMFSLATARVAGLALSTPVLMAAGIPMRAKVLLIVLIAAASYPFVCSVCPMAAPVTDVVGLVPMIVGEAAVGFCLGLIASMPLLFLEAAGGICGHQMGFGLARVYNPAADEDADVLGQLLYFIGFGTFLAVGGLERIFSMLIGTFEVLPPGAATVGLIATVDWTRAVGDGVELALRVSAPVTGIVIISSAVLGLIGKTMPQISIMSVGFTVKAVAGILVLALSVLAIGEVSADDIDAALRRAGGWAGLLGEVQAERALEEADHGR